VRRDDDVARNGDVVGDGRELGGGGRVRREVADALPGRRAAVVVPALVLDGARDELVRVPRVDGQLAANGNCTVGEVLLEVAAALPELGDLVQEAWEARVVGIGPAKSDAAGRDWHVLVGDVGIIEVVGVFGRHGRNAR